MAFSRYILFIGVSLLPSLALSQGAVQQSGPVVPGNFSMWLKNGIIKDSGVPAGSGFVTQSGNVLQGHVATWDRDRVIKDGGANALTTVPFLVATNFGVKADGNTADDVALKAAMDACTAQGTTLLLPAGKIRLTGGATSVLSNCSVLGVGVPAGSTTTASLGTTFQIESTTVKPFTCAANWALSGVNFYWPGQTTGTALYPAAISDNGVDECKHATIDHVVVVNGYDWLKQTPGGPGWGDIRISDITAYVVHDVFQLHTLGDSFAMTNIRLTPGPWLTMVPTNQTRVALDAASLNNSVVHVTAGSAVVLSMIGLNSEAWRYGVLIDNGGVFSGSIIIGGWDGTGTLIDNSAGGTYSQGNIFEGSSTFCGHAHFVSPFLPTGNTPCFTMGTGSYLQLDNFKPGVTRGDLIVTNGSFIYLKNSFVDGIGSAADGADYYVVKITGGTPAITLQNNRIAGRIGDTHVHGFSTPTTPAALIIQNNEFLYLNDVIGAATSPITTISGNTSFSTTGAASVVLTGTNQVMYYGNTFDKPPLATLSGCGGSPASHGGISGYFTTGSAAGTSCNITLPWVPYGLGAGACQFQIAGGAATVSGGPGGTPPTWALTFSIAYNSANVFYNCSGQQ